MREKIHLAILYAPNMEVELSFHFIIHDIAGLFDNV